MKNGQVVIDKIKAILKEYDAEIVMEEESHSYYSSDYVMELQVNSKWDKDGEQTQELEYIKLGRYFDAN